MKVKVLVTESCPTLWDPLNYSPPGAAVHGILQARILEWVAFPFSRGIFPNQGSNLGLPHCRQILYRLSHQGQIHINIKPPAGFSSADFPSEPRVQLLLAGLCSRFHLSGKLPLIAALGTGSLSARKAASAFISLAPGPRPVSNIWFIIASPCALRKPLIHLQRLCFQVTLHGHILVSVQVVPFLLLHC